jgi:subtilisin family serine protease
MTNQRRLPPHVRWALWAALLASPCFAQQQFVVTSESNIHQVAVQYGLSVVRPLDSKDDVYLLRAPDAPTAAHFAVVAPLDPKIQSVEKDQSAGIAESDSKSKASSTQETDPLVPGSAALVNYYGDLVRSGYANQAIATLINLPAAHSQYTLGGGIVAVIDTGIDPQHPVLQRWIVPGYDFVNNLPGVPNELADLSQSTVGLLDRLGSQVPMQLNQSTVGLLDQSTVGLLDGNKLPAAFGHGTMTSGLIHLAAPYARIMPLKAFHADGTGAISDIVRAIYYAADHGAKVINMSFSSTTPSPALNAAILYATNLGVICVASSGNHGGEVTVYPAASEGAIGIASTNAKDLRSIFSNHDVPSTRMAAPGEALITSYPGGHYAGVWGTSFSTALVSGVAALMTGMNYAMKPGQARNALDHGHRISDDMDIGNSRLDALASLLFCMTNSVSSSSSHTDE